MNFIGKWVLVLVSKLLRMIAIRNQFIVSLELTEYERGRE